MVTSVNAQFSIQNQIATMREQFTDLQRQLSTGKKSASYAGLGPDRLSVLSLRARASRLEGFLSTADQVGVRLTIMQQHLGRANEIAAQTRTEGLVAEFDLVTGSQTQLQLGAHERLNEMIALMNFEIGGRHLFAGRALDTAPVNTLERILDGDGARAGLKQIIAERRQADLGADGRGRLALAAPVAVLTGGVVANPADIGGAAPAQFTIDIGGNLQSFDVSDGGSDTLAALEIAIDAAFGADVAQIVGGNQLVLTATAPGDAISVTDIDAGAAALAGLTTGSSAPPPGATTISETDDPNVFGFKLATVTNGLTGTTAPQPTGSPPSFDVTFSASPPLENETLTLRLDLPDGTQTALTLKAVTGVPAQPGEFQIGADAVATAANFNAVVGSEIERLAASELQASSAIAASREFFNFDDANPPQRVAGPPFDSATALQDATQADTLFWYSGDAGTGPARATAVARVDENLTVDYGVRANESSIATVFSSLAVLAAEDFSTANPNDEARYQALTSRVAQDLAFPGNKRSVVDLTAELGFKQAAIDNAVQRHRETRSATEGLLEKFEEADDFEVSAKILQLQGQLQASFEATALISRLSLVSLL